ncbi:MAG: GntR family transcriptional regulator [Flaviflexus sp.]|nr:GntR family transcriptional regulator [Flaviflexus sp.]
MTTDPAALDDPFVPQIPLDRESAVPLYKQISDPITELILAGTLAPGQLIEDEVSLAHRLEVSRPTARRALQDLVNAGLLIRRRGVGTRVTPTHVHRQIGLTSLNEDLLKAGYTTRTEVISYQVHHAGAEFADKLDCPENEEVVTVERLRWINDVRLALMRNTLPSRVAPTFSELGDRGLYDCLESSGIRLVSAVQTVGAKNADQREASLLELPTGAAVLTMQRTSYGPDGRVVEYGSHLYDASQYHVTIPLVSP